MQKKLLCLALVLFLLVGAFAACGNNNDTDEPDPAFGTNGDASNQTTNDSPAEPFLPLETVLIEFDGNPVTWAEVFNDLNSVFGIFLQRGPVDLDAIITWQDLYDEELTYREFMLRYAVDLAMERRAIETEFHALGLSLEDNFYDELIEMAKMMYQVDEDELLELLAEANFTLDLFLYFNAVGQMHMQIQEHLFDDTTDIPANELNDFVAEEGILRAKHILIMLDGQSDDPTAKAAALYAELSGLSGAAQTARFDAMLAAYGEDPGMLSNPNGYTFVPGVMVPEFTEGTEALAYGEISPPILSGFGYHIILRLPVTIDDIVMLPGNNQSPLAPLITRTLTDNVIRATRDALTYTVLPLLLDLDPADVFFS